MLEPGIESGASWLVDRFRSVKYISRAQRTVWGVVKNRCHCQVHLRLAPVVGTAQSVEWGSYELDVRGIVVRFPAAVRDIFSSSRCRKGLWGPPSFLVNGHCGIFLRVKQSGREANHSSNLVPRFRLWGYTCTHLPGLGTGDNLTLLHLRLLASSST